MAFNPIKKAEIKISGMSCGHCASRVEKSLKDLIGVENAEVDIETEKATVEYNAEKLDPSELENAVDEAGYSVVNLIYNIGIVD